MASGGTFFESSFETKRLLDKLGTSTLGKPGIILAVHLAASNNPQALAGFLDDMEDDETRRLVHLLVIEQDGDRLDSVLRQRATASGAEFVSAARGAVPVQLLMDHASEAGAAAFIFIESQGRFHPLAFASLLLHFRLAPDSLAVYGDTDELTDDGCRRRPQFKPKWSPEYALSWNYVGAAVAFRAAREIFPDDGEIHVPLAASFELLLHVAGNGKNGAIGHVPRILFHQMRPEQTSDPVEQRQQAEKMVVRRWLERRHKGGDVEESKAADGTRLRRIIYPLAAPPPLVSVLIPSKDQPELLRTAVCSVLRADYERTEIIIIDNGSTGADQRALLDEFSQNEGIRVLPEPGPFNFSKLMNLGRRAAKGDVLVLMNDDVKSNEPGWLRELVSLSAQPDIGCVGALLLYEGGTVQHGGVIMNIHGGSEHAFRHVPADENGAGYRLKVRHEVSAVTAACLAVKTELFDAVQGFDENLPVTLNDVDFCLKVRAAGYRNLITPHARLVHYESVSRGLDMTPARLTRLARETVLFRRRWGAELMEDPHYSPHLSRSHADFRMRTFG